MKKIVTSIFLLIASISIVHAQEGPDPVRSWFGFNAGLEHYQVKEQLINGLTHKGMGFTLSGIFVRSLPESSHKLEIRAGLAGVKTHLETESESILANFNLRYRYIHRVLSFCSTDHLSMGGRASMNFNQGIYQNWDENHFYWLTTYSLGFEGIYTHAFSAKSRIALEFHLPLLNLVSRTPAERRLHEDNASFRYVLSTMHTNLVLASLPDHFAMDWKVEYNFTTGRGIQQAIFWRIEYINNSMPPSSRFTSLGQALGFEILF